jgi:hypothetical protein
VKRRGVLFVITANLVALVALAFVYPHLTISPGPLVKSHAALATDCFACHAPWRGASSARCIECHAPGDIGLRTTKGVVIAKPTIKASFHQQLIEGECMGCHSDHLGPLMNQRSRKPFSHALLRVDVRERCESCHQAPADRLHRQVKGSCQSCHTTQAWKPATFDHAKFFVLDRDHNVDCVTCHRSGDFSRYSCYGCHEHKPAQVRAEHLEEGITEFENCVECHRSAQEEPQRRGPGGQAEPGERRERNKRERERD